ncbi:MAG: sugar transferase [Lachnospira sp.]|nr:sugar transferase [Lachnospira sp.]
MYKKRLHGWIKHIDFMLLDVLSIQIAFAIAYMVKYGLKNVYEDSFHAEIAFALCVVDILVSVGFNTFSHVLKRGYFVELFEAFKKALIVELGIAFYLFLMKSGSDYSRFMFVVMGVIYFVVSYIFRALWKMYLRRMYRKHKKRKMLVVAQKNAVREVIQGINADTVGDIHIIGLAVTSDDLVGQEIEGVKVVANAETVVDYVCREWVDEVFVKIASDEPFPEKLVSQFDQMGVVVHLSILNTDELIDQNRIVERVGNYYTITSSINYVSVGQLFLKRLMDIVGGLIGTIFTGILFIFVAPAIYISSPGPIFFSQVRVGKNGKRFKIYKFRSMYMDAEERKKELMEQNRVKDGMMFKLDFDPRIIGAKQLPNGKIKKGLGNFIRDFSIDEFPQFLNVLRGDMSLVGTRPPTVDEWEKYELHHRARLATKPGITGMWQVSGRSNITDFEEVVKLDTKYISEWSIGLDIKIMLKTILVVFKREGSM